MGFGAASALDLLGSVTGAALVQVAHSLFRVAAPQVYALTIGALGLGAGSLLFYSGLGDGENGGWAVLGGFMLGCIYLAVAITSLVYRGQGRDMPWLWVLAVSSGGTLGGLGGVYILDWLPFGGLVWNVVGLVLGTALGTAVEAARTDSGPGDEIRAGSWSITLAGTLLLSYCTVVAVNGVMGPERSILPPRAVGEFARDLFHESPRSKPSSPDAKPAIRLSYDEVDCEPRHGRPGQVCGKIRVMSTGGEDLIVHALEIEADGRAAELQPWNVFVPEDSRNTCLLGKRYPLGASCDLIIRFSRDNRPAEIVIHENTGSAGGTRVWKRVPATALGG